MSVFNTPEWESNAMGDKACKETFKKSKSVSTKTKSKKKKNNNNNTDQVKKTITKPKQKKNASKEIKKKVETFIQKSNKSPKKLKGLQEENAEPKPKDRKAANTKIVNKGKKLGKPKSIKKQQEELPEESDMQEEELEEQFDNKLMKFKQKLADSLQKDNNISKSGKKKTFKNSTLRERMIEKLKAARFRYLNEELYTRESKEAEKVFSSDPGAFKAYHEGYRQQVQRWPLNPLDKIIGAIKKLPQKLIVADFGCGEAKLAASVPNKVHSFDLVAANPSVTACNMAHCPLDNSSVDIVVFCLSLMGTNLEDFLVEANRVLKVGGVMKIAEVESRFETVETFIQGVERFHFSNVWKDLSHNLFYFLDFKKQSNIKHKNKLPSVSLHPCMYKRR